MKRAPRVPGISTIVRVTMKHLGTKPCFNSFLLIASSPSDKCPKSDPKHNYSPRYSMNWHPRRSAIIYSVLHHATYRHQAKHRLLSVLNCSASTCCELRWMDFRKGNHAKHWCRWNKSRHALSLCHLTNSIHNECRFSFCVRIILSA